MNRNSLHDAGKLFCALENYNGDPFFSQAYAAVLKQQVGNGLDLLLNQGVHGMNTLFRYMLMFYIKEQYNAHIFHLGQVAKLLLWMNRSYVADAFDDPDTLLQRTCRQIELLHDSREDWRNPALCSRAIRQIECQYQTICLQDLSNYLGLNPSYLSRVLSQNFDASFLDILHTKRSLVAMDRFLNFKKSLPLEELAAELGYSSAHYFYCVFKRYTGLSPTEFWRLMCR